MDLKKLLYKMLVKYYLRDNIKAPFENFALGFGNAWAGPECMGKYNWKLIKSSTGRDEQTQGNNGMCYRRGKPKNPVEKPLHVARQAKMNH